MTFLVKKVTFFDARRQRILDFWAFLRHRKKWVLTSATIFWHFFDTSKHTFCVQSQSTLGISASDSCTLRAIFWTPIEGANVKTTGTGHDCMQSHSICAVYRSSFYDFSKNQYFELNKWTTSRLYEGGVWGNVVPIVSHRTPTHPDLLALTVSFLDPNKIIILAKCNE